MNIIDPALKVKDAERTKKQKESCIYFSEVFCSADQIDAEEFEKEEKGTSEDIIYKVNEERLTMDAFASYVVTNHRVKVTVTTARHMLRGQWRWSETTTSVFMREHQGREQT